MSNVTITSGANSTPPTGTKVATDTVSTGGTADENAQLVRAIPSVTPAVTAVAASTTNQTALSSSATRRGFRLYNGTTGIAYVKYGVTASTSSYSAKVQPDDWLVEDAYGGRVDVIWATTATGNALVTELSA